MDSEVTSIVIGGAALQPLICGALYWPQERTIVVADLHLEKGSSRRIAPHGLPPFDTLETLERLERALGQTDARRIVSLGDSFHDEEGPARMPEPLRLALARLMRGREWIWIEGNHEGAAAGVLGGQSMREVAIASLLFRHAAAEDVPPGMAEVSGHYHPKAAVSVRGRRVAGACFVHDARRMILPAYGAYTGGLSVFDTAIRRWFTGDFTVYLKGRGRLFRFAATRSAVIAAG